MKNDNSNGPKPHDWVMDLQAYVPGLATVEGVDEVVKLSANESCFGASPKAVEAFKKSADNIMRYPDGGSNELRTAIAKSHDLDAEKIICGAGSDDILTLLIHTYAGPGKEVIYSQYGFMVYPIQTKAVGAVGVPVPNKDWAADVDGILAAVTDKTALVFIDNPNNPTGAYLCWEEVERLHAGLPDHVVLVLDAAYAECVTVQDYKAGESLVETADNVIMTRTFSKMYALASLRVGWGYGAPSIIDALNRVRMPFNVCLPAQEAAVAAAADQAFLAESVTFNTKWRDWLTAELVSIGLSVVPSQTNFILIEFPAENQFTAEKANAFLTKNGYLVRWLPGLGLVNHLRLSIGTEKQNHTVVALIKEFMNG